jgi:hypothetical protein
VELSEYCIRNRVSNEIYTNALDLFLEFNESYKKKHGSCKGYTGEEYHKRMRERHNWAEQKTKEYIVSKMVKVKLN